MKQTLDTSHKTALKIEVVDFMRLVAARNPKDIESKFPILTASLQKRQDSVSHGLLLFVKGITCFFKNNYDEARTHFEEIFELSLSLEDTDLHGIAHMGLGLTCRSGGRLDEAVTQLSLAVDVIERGGPFKDFLTYCNHQLGEIHVAIADYENAIRYFKNDFAISRSKPDNLGAFRYHMGLGGCFLKMKEYEKSKVHLLQAAELKDLPPPIVSRIQNDLGELHLEMKEFDQAEKLLLSSMATRESLKLEDATCTSMTSLAEVYIEQQRISEALELLNRCLSLVDKYQTKWKKVRVLHLLARSHSLAKNYEEAIRYYDEHESLHSAVKEEQERNIFRFKNAQIERQKKTISDKHAQLAVTLEEIKRLKVDRKAAIFSWTTIIILVVISELFLDPLIENFAYNNVLSLLVKVMIALLFKPLDGLYEKILWERTIKKS